jgi:hypothetical protein
VNSKNWGSKNRSHTLFEPNQPLKTITSSLISDLRVTMYHSNVNLILLDSILITNRSLLWWFFIIHLLKKFETKQFSLEFFHSQYTFDYFPSKLECVGVIGIIIIEMKSN